MNTILTVAHSLYLFKLTRTVTNCLNGHQNIPKEDRTKGNSRTATEIQEKVPAQHIKSKTHREMKASYTVYIPQFQLEVSMSAVNYNVDLLSASF